MTTRAPPGLERLREGFAGRRLDAAPSQRCGFGMGARYDRLVALKRVWDPDNVFHLNQNITLREE